MLDHKVVLFLVFWENFILFSTVCTNLHSQECAGVPFFPHSHPRLLFVLFFNDTCSDRCKVISHFCFDSVSSVQLSNSVMSISLQPHELQNRPPCISPTPRVYPKPCPSSWWCHPTVSSSVVPFSSCPQSFPASGSFQMSQLFAESSPAPQFKSINSLVLSFLHGTTLTSIHESWKKP